MKKNFEEKLPTPYHLLKVKPPENVLINTEEAGFDIGVMVIYHIIVIFCLFVIAIATQ